jgi:acyl carrier protein
MNEFLDRMSAILETSVTAETRFREVEGWSSLMGFGILVTLENDYGRRMMIDEFRKMQTIGDLAAACGVA